MCGEAIAIGVEVVDARLDGLTDPLRAGVDPTKLYIYSDIHECSSC